MYRTHFDDIRTCIALAKEREKEYAKESIKIEDIYIDENFIKELEIYNNDKLKKFFDGLSDEEAKVIGTMMYIGMNINEIKGDIETKGKQKIFDEMYEYISKRDIGTYIRDQMYEKLHLGKYLENAMEALY